MSSRGSTSRGSAGWKAPPAAIGASSTARTRRTEIQLCRHGVRSPALAAPGGRRHRSGGAGLRRRLVAGRGEGISATLALAKIAILTFLPAVMFGWTVETVPIESFSPGELAAIAGFRRSPRPRRPIVCAAACGAGRGVPSLASLFGRSGERRDPIGLGARRDARRADAARGRGGAGPGVRSALSRPAVRRR